MKRVRVTPLASSDLGEIEEYISQDNPEAALKLVQEIRSKCEMLGNHPEAGDKRNRLRPGLRGFPVHNYIIFYRIIDDQVEVLRILHGARDVPSLFQ